MPESDPEKRRQEANEGNRASRRRVASFMGPQPHGLTPHADDGRRDSVQPAAAAASAPSLAVRPPSIPGYILQHSPLLSPRLGGADGRCI